MTPEQQSIRIQGTQPKLYLVVDDVPWRVHDADFREFRAIPRRLGDLAAQSRYFMSEDGTSASTRSRSATTTGSSWRRLPASSVRLAGWRGSGLKRGR